MKDRTVWIITIMLLVWSALWMVTFKGTRSDAQELRPVGSLHYGVGATVAQHDSEAGAVSTRPPWRSIPDRTVNRYRLRGRLWDPRRRPIKPGDSSWFARLFMKSYIQIEDDPRIWQQAAELIDEQLEQPPQPIQGKRATLDPRRALDS